jgi:hypothetical protein
MPLNYVLDEDSRGPLWVAIRQHNARDTDPIDVVRVGDLPAIPLSTPDPVLLAWAEREGRILVSRDKKTMGAIWTLTSDPAPIPRVSS